MIDCVNVVALSTQLSLSALGICYPPSASRLPPAKAIERTAESGRQEPRAAAERRSLCWRARPLAECKSWIVTETSLEVPVVSTSIRQNYPEGYQRPRIRDFGSRVAFTVGSMANIGANRATGVTATVAADDPGVSGRVELRRRRWTDAEQGIEYSGGLTVREKTRPNWGSIAWTGGVTAGLTLDTGIIGVSTRLEAVPSNGRIATAWLAGGRASGKSGITALAGFGGFVLWAIATGYGEAT